MGAAPDVAASDHAGTPTLTPRPPHAAGPSPKSAATGEVPPAITEEPARRRVIDKETQAGVPGAIVGWVADAKRGYIDGALTTGTDEKGAFTLPTAESAAAKILVRASGYLPLLASPDVHLVALERGESIVGRVIDGHGRPVEGVEVIAASDALQGSWPMLPEQISVRATEAAGVTKTDAKGEFDLSGLFRDVDYRVWVRGSRHVPLGADITGVVARTGTRVLLHVQPITTVYTTAVDDATGEAIPDALVSLWLLGPKVDRGVMQVGYALYWRDVLQLPVRAGWGASYFVPNPSKGQPDDHRTFEFGLRASALGYAPHESRRTVKTGEDSEIRIRLTPLVPPSDWSDVFFTARTKGGRKFSGTLALRVGQNNKVDTPLNLSFREGRAVRSVRLPPGHWRFFVEGGAPDGTWWGRPAPAGALEVAGPGSGSTAVDVPIVLEGGSLRLRVEDADGVEIRGYALKVGTPQNPGSSWGDPWLPGKPIPSESIPNETRPLLWLPEGDARLTVRHPGYTTAVADVLITDRPTDAEVRIVLRR